MAKFIWVALFFIFGIFTQAAAGPGAFFGISYNFGTSTADWGVTVKVLSDDEEDKVVAAAGLSFFPFDKQKKIGFDLGGGYLCNDIAGIIGWDFLHKKPQISFGYVNTDDHDSSSKSEPEPEPEPIPGT